jgi:hypothetical protein
VNDQQRYVLFQTAGGVTLRMNTYTGTTWVLSTRDTLQGAKARWVEVDDSALLANETPAPTALTTVPAPAIAPAE